MLNNRKKAFGVPYSVLNLLPVIVEELLSSGVKREVAVPLAAKISDGFTEKFKGLKIYIKKTVEGNAAFSLSMEQVVAEALIACGVPQAQAAAMGRRIAASFCSANLGASLYISKGIRQEIAKKKALIVAEYNGTNAEELARKYNLSVVRIYQIIGQARAQARGSSPTKDPAAPGLLESARGLSPEASCEALAEIAALMDSGAELREIRPKFKQKIKELLSIQEKDE